MDAVLVRLAEPPALSPRRGAPRGMGDRPNLADLGGAGGGVLATRRVAQFAATPCGGLQLVGARCCSPLAANR